MVGVHGDSVYVFVELEDSAGTGSYSNAYSESFSICQSWLYPTAILVELKQVVYSSTILNARKA